MADQLSPIDSRHHKVIPQALLIEPKEVIKFPGPHNQPISVHMKLTNPTHERIAFKVKTTNALFYNVKPIYGIIEPGKMETITIQLKQLIGADGKLMNSNFQPQKHKFLVLSAYAKEGENDPLEIIKVAQENRTELMDTRFRCAFDLPSNLQASESKTAQSVQSFDHVMVTPRNELPNEDNLLFNTQTILIIACIVWIILFSDLFF